MKSNSYEECFCTQLEQCIETHYCLNQIPSKNISWVYKTCSIRELFRQQLTCSIYE